MYGLINIGCIADWVEMNIKHRGLCVDIVNEHAHLVVIGSSRIHTIHLGSLLLHKKSEHFIDLCRDES